MTVDRILAIAGLLVGLIAIPISVVIARRGRRRPSLCYAIDFDVIIAPEDDLLARGLKIRLDEREISQVSRTRVAIWNDRGSDTIHGRDIVEDDLLRLQLAAGDTVLQVRVLSYSRRHNKITIDRVADDPERVIIDFDFIDALDGAIFEILHEGPEWPEITGTVRGSNLNEIDIPYGHLNDLPLIGASLRRRIAPRHSLRKILPFAGLVIAGMAAFVGMMLYLMESSQNSDLVSPERYNLTTVSGQEDFARAVLSIEGSPLGWVLTNGPYFIVLLVIGSLLMVYFRRIVLRRIPATVVTNRVDINEQATDAE